MKHIDRRTLITASRDLIVNIALPGDAPRDGRLSRLTGPAPDAIESIRLDSSPFLASRGRATVELPRASAAVISHG